jgi:hypothetical protein
VRRAIKNPVLEITEVHPDEKDFQVLWELADEADSKNYLQVRHEKELLVVLFCLSSGKECMEYVWWIVLECTGIQRWYSTY